MLNNNNIAIKDILKGASQVAPVVKNLPASVQDARDMGSIPGSERSPGVGNGNPLQYSYLENPMDSGAWRLHNKEKWYFWGDSFETFNFGHFNDTISWVWENKDIIFKRESFETNVLICHFYIKRSTFFTIHQNKCISCIWRTNLW